VNKQQPPLLIPRAPGVINVTVTTAAPAPGTGRSLMVPAGALKKEAGQLTKGVFGQNAALYAVGTNIAYTWPTANVTFNTTKRTGTLNQMYSAPGQPGNTIQYSNVKGRKFGGPAVFSLQPGPAAGHLPGPVTIYFKVGPDPACGGCGAILLPAYPGTKAAIGGVAQNNVNTAGLPLVNLSWVGSFLANGTPGVGATQAGAPANNPAVSYGYPWTTGKITVIATGGGEAFVLSGTDQRTPSGQGVVQMVSGALSNRTLSNENANRGWVRIEVGKIPSDTPALSPVAQLGAAGLLILAAGYVVRRRIVSSGLASA
jgi:hypothetical protein